MPQAPGSSGASAAPLGLGIAGLGMAGAVMVRAAAGHPGIVLRGAADPHEAPRQAFARDFNAPVFADIRDLCADPGVEIDKFIRQLTDLRETLLGNLSLPVRHVEPGGEAANHKRNGDGG